MMARVKPPPLQPAFFLDSQSASAKAFCLRRPISEARSDHICHDATHISLLRRIIIWTCMIARDSHRPVAFALPETLQKAGGVIDIETRLQHRADGWKFARMIVMIDLHAAKIDQLCTFSVYLSETL